MNVLDNFLELFPSRVRVCKVIIILPYFREGNVMLVNAFSRAQKPS